MSNFLYSYTDFIRDRINFKKVDSVGPNRFDSPAALYYKIVFYFSDEHGLLGLYNVTVDNTDPSVSQAANMSASFTGSSETPQTIKNNVFRNTAYNYLLLNDEMERAEYLKRFLILLSDISADSPWYFQEISGLDAALERKVFSDGEFKIEDKPKSITIKCLNDSYDNRIGTLLDLYRAACFSYQNKKEIVPANLRKFNMGILVFNAPIRGKGGKSGDPNNMILIPDSQVSFYVPSCKLIELRNCEFDYNSAKSAFGTLNTTQEAFEPQYTITINFDECYESRYNEIAQMVVTDFINIDIRKERLGGLYEDLEEFGVNPFGNENGKLSYLDDSKEFWTNKTLQTGTSNDGLDKVYSTHIVSDNTNITNTQEIANENALSTNIRNNINNISANVNSLSGNQLTDKLLGLNSPLNDAIRQGKQIMQKISNPGNILKNAGKNLINSGKSALKKEIDKLYIGNLGGNSIRDILTQTNRVLSGDITPVIGFVKSQQIDQSSSKLPDYKKQEEKKEKEKEKVKVDKKLTSALPGWQKQRTEFLTKMNTAKSLRNNL